MTTRATAPLLPPGLILLRQDEGAPLVLGDRVRSRRRPGRSRRRYEELRRLGVPAVPAVAVGDRAVHGWNPPAYAALLGVPYQARDQARRPAVLAARLDVDPRRRREPGPRRFPTSAMDWKPPERDRTLRDLGYHVFRLCLAFVDAMDQRPTARSRGWGTRRPADMRDERGRARATARWCAGGWPAGSRAPPASEYRARARRLLRPAVRPRPAGAHRRGTPPSTCASSTSWPSASASPRQAALPVDAFQGLPAPRRPLVHRSPSDGRSPCGRRAASRSDTPARPHAW